MKMINIMFLSIILAVFLMSGAAYAKSHARVSYNEGVKYAIQGEFSKAKEEFENALKIDRFYRQAGQSLEAVKDVIKQKVKVKTAIYLFKGISNANKGQYKQAIKDYNKAIEINPKYAEAYYNMGNIYAINSHYDRAISNYNKAIEINQKFYIAYVNRGNAYSNRGQCDRAITDFTKAIEINPKFAKAYYNRGVAYYDNDQHDQAIEDWTKAIDINPEYANAYNNRGRAYDYKGQYDLAISDYNMAIEINPKFAQAYYNLGYVYIIKLGDMVKGCAASKKACALGECRNYNAAKQKGFCS